jgi:hypothetical protein
MNSANRINFRPALRPDLPAIIALLAADALELQRERVAGPLPESYLQAFDAIMRDERNSFVHETRTDVRRIYADLGFRGSHVGMRMALP